MIQNRLRLSQPHEFLSDLRNRRKSKLKRRTTIRASKMTTVSSKSTQFAVTAKKKDVISEKPNRNFRLNKATMTVEFR